MHFSSSLLFAFIPQKSLPCMEKFYGWKRKFIRKFISMFEAKFVYLNGRKVLIEFNVLRDWSFMHERIELGFV